MARYCLLLAVQIISTSNGFIFDDLHIGGNTQTGEKCYDDFGCFNNNPPFHTPNRLMTFLPQDLSHIRTKFILYTRDTWNASTAEIMDITDLSDESHFDGERVTKIIMHGFTQSSRDQWVQDMIRELLKHGDMNVIAVDWEKGAQLPYGQAAANTRVVGAQVAQLIGFLVSTYNTTDQDMHIIGHGLGTHAAGYAGERTAGLGRITGLDPSEPYFGGTAPQVRLDPSDATFVDVIHTDGSDLLSLGMGSAQVMGHVDFYPNGGVNQPGCDQDFFSKITHTAWNAATVGLYSARGAVACSHLRSADLFTESINTPCPFTAYPCTSANNFNIGHCLTCPGNGCSRLGYHADSMPGRGSFYLDTQDSVSFCSYHYQLNVTSQNAVDGIVTVALYGEKGRSSPSALTTQNEIINTGDSISHLVTTRTDVGTVSGASVRFDKSHTPFVHLLYSDTWTLATMAVWSGEKQLRTVFCAGGKEIPDQSTTVIPAAGSC